MSQSNSGNLWYKNAIIYALDVDRFADSNGDGIGDFRGAMEHMGYLADLGVTCIWLLPFYSSPDRDNGYDIMNYYDVDPKLGTLNDFMEFVRVAGEHGIRVIIDLVMNHTSDRHPWFQAARRDRNSRYRNYYRWADNPDPVPPDKGTIFPEEEDTVWTYDEVAGSYYHHRFYHHQPELNTYNPEVREEIFRVLDFWLSFGISGFRVDAAPHMISTTAVETPHPAASHQILKDMRAFVTRRHPDAILLAESDVEPEELAEFFGDGDEFHLLFNFALNNYLYLALARQSARPITAILKRLPAIQETGQWANFLRNLDEVDLERLTDEERAEVLDTFAPDENMRIFGRGMRRRLAPILDGDIPRMKLAFSLLFSLPGTPVIVYGDEIGMGEDLSQHGRKAVRTPMQWSGDAPNCGFSTAPKNKLVQPMIDSGPFDCSHINVELQRNDPGSFWHWVRKLLLARRNCPEIGFGTWHSMGLENESVLAHRCTWKDHTFLAIHNFSEQEQTTELDLHDFKATGLVDVFRTSEDEVIGAEDGVYRFSLAAFEYRWFWMKR